jgi:hypothetical protein
VAFRFEFVRLPDSVLACDVCGDRPVTPFVRGPLPLVRTVCVSCVRALVDCALYQAERPL